MLTVNNYNYIWCMISDEEKKFFENLPLGRRMARVTKNYYGALSKRAEVFGIDRHFAPLITIENIEGTKKKCTQQYLSDLLNCDKVTMVRILDYLFERGMITRTVNPDDRREHIILLTTKAKKVMPGIRDLVIEMNKTALNGLTIKEQELFNGFVSTIIKNLENLPVNRVYIKIKKKK